MISNKKRYHRESHRNIFIPYQPSYFITCRMTRFMPHTATHTHNHISTYFEHFCCRCYCLLRRVHTSYCLHLFFFYHFIPRSPSHFHFIHRRHRLLLLFLNFCQHLMYVNLFSSHFLPLHVWFISCTSRIFVLRACLRACVCIWMKEAATPSFVVLHTHTHTSNFKTFPNYLKIILSTQSFRWNVWNVQ